MKRISDIRSSFFHSSVLSFYLYRMFEQNIFKCSNRNKFKFRYLKDIPRVYSEITDWISLDTIKLCFISERTHIKIQNRRLAFVCLFNHWSMYLSQIFFSRKKDEMKTYPFSTNRNVQSYLKLKAENVNMDFKETVSCFCCLLIRKTALFDRNLNEKEVFLF